MEPSWSWSYGSWIYNYLSNLYLSPLTLWVESRSLRGVLDITLCGKVCRWFSPGTMVSSTDLNWPPRYNWNIIESCVKHHYPPTLYIIQKKGNYCRTFRYIEKNSKRLHMKESMTLSCIRHDFHNMQTDMIRKILNYEFRDNLLL